LGHLLFCLSFLFISIGHLSAQSRQYLFSHLGTRDGLASDNVLSSQQDEKGYIWIATNNGLQRYDGQRFLTFRHESNNQLSIPQGAILGMKLDKRNRLWLLCAGFKVGYLNIDDFTFHEVAIRYSMEDLNKLEGNLYIDNHGNLVLVAVRKAIFTYNEEKKEFSQKQDLVKIPQLWKPVHISQDKNDNFWIGCDSGLVKFNPATKLISYRGQNSENDDIIKRFGQDRSVVFTYIDDINRFWITIWPETGMHIKSYDQHSGKLLEWQSEISRSVKGRYFELRSITRLKDGSTWFAGRNLFAKLNPAGTGVEHVNPDAGGEFSIRYDDVNHLFEDREMNTWISTDKGLYRFNPSAQLFQAVVNKRPGNDSAYTPEVTDIIQLKNGEIYVSTWGNAVFSYNSNFVPVSDKKLGLSRGKGEMMTWCIHERPNGDIWRGHQGGSLFVYNAANRSTLKIQDTVFENSTIRQIVEDRNMNLWIGTQRGYLVKADPVTKKFRLLQKLQSPVSRMLADSSNYIWVCTTSNGVFKINATSGVQEAHYTTSGKAGKSLRTNNASDILQYNDSMFIIAGNGLNILNARTGNIQYFNTENGLPTNDVTNLVIDRRGYIWMTTGVGVVSYHIAKEKMSTYNEMDGVHTNSFNISSSTILKDGRIAFGTAHDVLVFDPLKVTVEDYVAPRVEISGFSVMNKSLPIDSIIKSGTVELQYDRNAIMAEFSSLTYQNVYPIYYKMENLDKYWIESGGLKQAIYNYIPPGKYTLKVACKNVSGKIGQVTSLDIIVRAPFWKTTWFYSLISLGLIGIFFWLDKLRILRLKSEQQIRSDIAGNLHEEVNTTLQNINVLSEIAGMKAHSQPEKSQEYIYEIQQKSRNMVIAMNDVLWSIDPANDSMPKTLERLHELAESLKSRHGVEVVVQTDDTLAKLKLTMKKRVDLILFYKLAMVTLIEELHAQKTYVHLNRNKSQLILKIDSPGTLLARTNAVSRNIAEMKTRANAIHGKFEFTGTENGISVILKVMV
jgi:ligand-binding sensor domain-containing protein